MPDQQTYEEGSWQILEPIMLVEASAPSEFQGAVIAMISKRNGIMISQEGISDWFTLYAEVSIHSYWSLFTQSM
ncbi:hypothetical protein J6590_054172 [Homalodisca vitripennis]|nr:hypothetical protein J6590_054172 [Homalodisca vitripennis]